MDRVQQAEANLDVNVWTIDGFIRAGVLELRERGYGQFCAYFTYTSSYLNRPDAFPLDPLNLPLGGREFHSTLRHDVLGAIFDAGPDSWGQMVFRACVDLGEQHMTYRHAFRRGSDGIGALLLTEETVADLASNLRHGLVQYPAFSQLAEVAHAVRTFASGGLLDDAMKAMLAGSWTIGGAQPKAILRDDRPGAAKNSTVIAKFEGKDRQERGANRMEWATLRMASEMGMRVPRCE